MSSSKRILNMVWPQQEEGYQPKPAIIRGLNGCCLKLPQPLVQQRVRKSALWTMVWVLWALLYGGTAAAAGRGFDASHFSVEGVGGIRTVTDQRGGVLHVHYDNPRGEGHIRIHQSVHATFHERLGIRFPVRGEGPDADWAIRLYAARKETVLQAQRFSFRWPSAWTEVSMPATHLTKVLGPVPASGVPLNAVEWIITPRGVGRGDFEIRSPIFHRRPPPYRAEEGYTLTAPGWERGKVGEGLQTGEIRPSRRHRARDILLDLGRPLEVNGVIVQACKGASLPGFWIEVSRDRVHWTAVSGPRAVDDRVRGGFLNRLASRYIRLKATAKSHENPCVGSIEVVPSTDGLPQNDYLGILARALPEGTFPRSFWGHQMYFTVVGHPDSPREALLSDEGSIEPSTGDYSLSPFLYEKGRLITRSDGMPSPDLMEPDLPLPRVVWAVQGLRLQIQSVEDSHGVLWLRYTLENQRNESAEGRFFLAIRPFGVNPPWQNLNLEGGFSALRSLESQGDTVLINDRTTIRALTPGSDFGALRDDQAGLVEGLLRGKIPDGRTVNDPEGWGQGAFAFDFKLASGQQTRFDFEVSREAKISRRDDVLPAEDPFDTATSLWRERLSKPRFFGSPTMKPLVDGVMVQRGYLLIHRDSPALFPGSRTYERAWIRDGALMGSALLAMGEGDAVRRFIDWYAGYQRMDGSIPCCISRSGVEQAVEHDSHGEFIALVADYFRHTGDLLTLKRLWPNVRAAVVAIERLREGERVGPSLGVSRIPSYGLMPRSISHEGYSGNPVHAFWDDAWTLRGLRDATFLAGILHDPLGPHIDQQQRSFAVDFKEAVAKTIQKHRLSVQPASVELGDTDVNAAAMAVNLETVEGVVPDEVVRQTFDDYVRAQGIRRQGLDASEAYTPYEVRSVEALVRLGRKEAALALLDDLLKGQRPSAWKQWPEIVWRDADAPRFIGDMPHAWIGAEFIRSFRSLFVFERERVNGLVIAGGLLPDWLDSDKGLGIDGVSTRFGRLSYQFVRSKEDELQLTIRLEASMPPGSMVIHSPDPRPIRSVVVDGQPLSKFAPHQVELDHCPQTVVFHY